MRNKRIIVRLLILFLLCILAASGADSMLATELKENEWVWNPGEAASFEGNVILNQDSDIYPVTLRLMSECVPALPDSGKVAFISVNDQKLTIRNQKDEWVADNPDRTEIHFVGNWFVPESTGLRELHIVLRVYDRDGGLVGESKIVKYNDTELQTNSARSLPDLGRMMWICLGIAGFIWMLAIVRIIFYQRRRKKNADF